MIQGIQKSCRDSVADKSQVEAYTEATAKNAAGFDAFNTAFFKKDLDGVMAAMTDNPIFDAPNPQPDGTCYQGRLAVKAVWEIIFKSGVQFEVEESFSTGDRAVVRWAASLTENGTTQTLRGVDVFQLENGKVAAKLTYSKAESFLGLPNPPAILVDLADLAGKL